MLLLTWSYWTENSEVTGEENTINFFFSKVGSVHALVAYGVVRERENSGMAWLMAIKVQVH